ncbi:LysR family transcriptional regulator [Pseudoclavibacter chungangensis]|uniref:LysR family transcriptional regulator n=1 Tax=Pseudoclavibacter chungangensis TaxID=587635 RepID=A0A7J5BP39_9MICO|nr:LysR family transcriptional regulator [Pseudoclavibacter chungangensis]KAB1654534.1 LysR family transcriptional regulator [Pseudoclavibacter chungangensis]NYJ68239.1 DNA-binding transcriptional LysR family regulator [Pseudoclavibacter chungangensis]
MDLRRLTTLLELSRSESMRVVADELGTTTSSVSQQMALLSKEVGVALLEPEGRGIRLTPAGHRLAAHAAEILAAVEAARSDLDPDAEPSGTLRVAGFSTAIRRSLMPIIDDSGRQHPGLRIVVHEHEPDAAIEMLLADRVDIALTYDYNLSPLALDARLDAVSLWRTRWGLAVPSGRAPLMPGGAAELFDAYRDSDWIANSRNRADEDVLRTIAALAGFEPRMRHEAESLDLVEDLVRAGMGIGLLPESRTPVEGVTIVPLHDPEVHLRASAHILRGRSSWPPLRYVLGRLTADAGEQAEGAAPGPWPKLF